MDLSSDFLKKVGDLNKKESGSLDFTGLKIPRDYFLIWEGIYFRPLWNLVALMESIMQSLLIKRIGYIYNRTV